jgi:hypothetical protein
MDVFLPQEEGSDKSPVGLFQSARGEISMSRVVLNVVFGTVAVSAVGTALVFACRRFAPRYEVHTANKGEKIIVETDPTPWGMKMAAKILFVIGMALAATAAMLQASGITVPWL